MTRIVLFRQAGSWMARSDDPVVHRLFETDTLPTAFLDTAPASDVLREIRRLNPNVEVLVDEGRHMIADGYFFPYDWRRETKGLLYHERTRTMKTGHIVVHNDDVVLVELLDFPGTEHGDARALVRFFPDRLGLGPDVRVTIALVDVDQGEVLLERDVHEGR